MTYNKGKGKGIQWILAHVDYDGEGCLIWPLSRNPETGYGMFGLNGELLYAHRHMCTLANGPPPSPEHEAAHSCGNGRGGCAHPKHLDWKTPSENALDCRAHGTHLRNTKGSRQTLTDEQVAEIRSLNGEMTQRNIANKFGCSPSTVRDIFSGRSRSRPRKIKQPFTDDQVREIRRLGTSMTMRALAVRYSSGEIAVAQVFKRQTYRDVPDIPAA